LAEAAPNELRASGVTTVRAEALVQAGVAFATGDIADRPLNDDDAAAEAEKLLAIRGVGRWTVRSTLLWGVGHPDAHPSGDVALLRAAAKQDPTVTTLRELAARAEAWRPHRAWAARLLWLDLLGHAEDS
jgi:3-methyladenine DNA glycosylase/8-oxoguanine DNA glycosylase